MLLFACSEQCFGFSRGRLFSQHKRWVFMRSCVAQWYCSEWGANYLCHYRESLITTTIGASNDSNAVSPLSFEWKAFLSSFHWESMNYRCWMMWLALQQAWVHATKPQTRQPVAQYSSSAVVWENWTEDVDQGFCLFSFSIGVTVFFT